MMTLLSYLVPYDTTPVKSLIMISVAQLINKIHVVLLVAEG